MTYVEGRNITLAWRAAVAGMVDHKECVPLVVTFRGVSTDDIEEEPTVRASLEALLKKKKKQSVETVASTIFPVSLWNRDKPRARLFARYNAVLDRLHRASKQNRRGLYFERMTSGGPPGAENQLDFAIREFASRPGVRRSMLQVATFHPALDHSRAARLGFPCLQQVAFTPVGNEIHVAGFYASQYLVERAYGNYLGLARLGQFVAHQLRRELKSVTCVSGVMVRDATVAQLKAVLKVYEPSMEET